MVIALAACGGGGHDVTASTTRCVRPPAGTGPGATATLQVGDAGRTYCLRRGATLAVLLRAVAGSTTWSTPTTSNPRVLPPTANGALSLPIGVTGAAFHAQSRGHATISAVRPPCTIRTIATCDHTDGWRARVVVQ
jgi:hypothetical protein